jgi:tetratricopeptide (TPR) repeat protein
LLTDPPKRQYTEPQTGLLYNQAGSDSGLTPFKHVFFPPQSVMRWREIWFPVKDIGGLVAASPYAALNVERFQGKLKVGVCPLQLTNDELVVTLAGETISSQRLTLKPMETFIQTIEVGDKKGEIAVTLGEEKLSWTSGDKEANRLGRPVVSPKDFSWSSAEGLYVAGEELTRQRSYGEAMTKFLACLEKESGHVRALTRVAEIHFRRTEYLKALDCARKALAIDAYDAGANFIYGTINRQLGLNADAKDGFGWAARSLEFRSASYEQLAEVNIIERKLERAAEYAQRSLEYNAYNLNARELQAVLFRLRNNPEAAAAALDDIVLIDPLCHFVRFERYLLDSSDAKRRAFASLIRSELPHETYLELAMFYFNLGLPEEAAMVLEVAPSHPVISYWLAYLRREKDAAKSRQYLGEAEAASPHLVFPWAATQVSGWKTPYYLGLLLWNAGMIEEAKGLFKGLASGPDWAPFYLTRARLLENEGDRERNLADIQKAVSLEEENWRAWRALTGFYERNGDYERALLSAEAIYLKQPEKPALVMDYAKALLHNGKPEACLKLLERSRVLPYEGAWEGRDLYRQAHLFSAAMSLKNKQYGAAAASAERAKLWPEHLGVGKPFDVDERVENFIRATAVEKSGDREEAKRLYASVCTDTEKFRSSWDSVHLFGAMALRKTGKEEEALRLLADWRTARGEADPLFAWAEAKYHGDEATADTILSRMKSSAGGATWDSGTGDRNFSLVREIMSAFIQK